MEETNEALQEPIAQAQVEEVAQQPQTDKEINFKAVREKMDALERQNQYLNAKIMEQERKQVEPAQPTLKDDDIPTWGDVQKARQNDSLEISRLKEQLQDMRMRTSNSDYEQTVREYLPDVLKEDPDLALAIQDNPHMHKLAYRLAQASPRYHEKRLANQNASAVSRIVENASKVTPSTARKNVTMQDEEAKIASMSDSQILDMFNTAKARY